MTPASGTRTLKSLRCSNPYLNGLLVTVVRYVCDGPRDYFLVATGVGSGEYRALAEELVDPEPTGEACAMCSSMQLVRQGTCKLCLNCGETTGCS